MAQSSTRQISQTIAADAGGEAGEAIIIDAVVAMLIELTNDGANALTGLKLQIRAHEDAAWFDYLTDAELTADAGGYWLHAPAETVLHTLASAGVVNYGLHLPAAQAIRFVATSSSGTTLTIRGTIQNQN